MWEVRVGQPVTKGGRECRDVIARMRGKPGYSSIEIIGVIPEGRGLSPRDQEQQCVDIFQRCVREIAAQQELPIRR
jgi:hypothetical protein